MSIGGGAQKGTQYGSQSGTSSSTANTTQAGTTDQTGTASQTGSTSVTAPQYFRTGAERASAGEGQTYGQQTAAGYYGQQINETPESYAGRLRMAGDYYQDPNNPDRNANTVAMMRQLYPSLYKTPQDVTPGTVSVGDASAGVATGGQASSYLPNYTTNYTEGVVNPTISDMSRAFEEKLTSLKSTYGGAWGGSGSQVAGGQAVGDYVRGLGTVIGGLRNTGYGTNLGAAASDASNVTGANVATAGNITTTSNQDKSRALAASSTNAANSLDAQKTNQAAANQVAEYDANQADVGAARRMAINKGAEDNIISRAGISSANAGSLAKTAADQFSQWISSLGASIPLLGSDVTGSSTNKNTGATSSTGSTDTTGDFSGNSSGGSSSKGGGISALLCWVAREVYGAHDPRWVMFRDWLTTEAPKWLLRLYSAHGERFAKFISDKPLLKALVRAAMDCVIEEVSDGRRFV